ncbi:SMI1/KNR4 family protein [Flavihumibacter petaseus]|uniref:Knr4/Smi1-like domain-containing protein n=1 Tax=Flavihumibacter petaseus NBRC 106054 TaxID=1220578 RepID=A0A0E9N7I1_9BACT|nr:SMI1/KNR4 family protein [Flavihumibacter petaseus]GAO45671.1 hypothetical protein FPE01S_07_00590 [Flavihumibacter petaseus NBRC 106054]
MENLILRKLDELKLRLSKLKAPLLEYLGPSLTTTEIRDMAISTNVELPEEVFSLYEWHNGVHLPAEYYLGQAWIFPGIGFFPFSNAVERYNQGANADEYWEGSKFLIFESGGGEMYLIECDKGSPEFGMIFLHSYGSHDGYVIKPVYDSLDTFLSTAIECYRKGLCVIDERFFGVNFIKGDTVLPELLAIRKAFNPKADKWKQDNSP